MEKNEYWCWIIIYRRAEHMGRWIKIRNFVIQFQDWFRCKSFNGWDEIFRSFLFFLNIFFIKIFLSKWLEMTFVFKFEKKNILFNINLFLNNPEKNRVYKRKTNYWKCCFKIAIKTIQLAVCVFFLNNDKWRWNAINPSINIQHEKLFRWTDFAFIDFYFQHSPLSAPCFCQIRNLHKNNDCVPKNEFFFILPSLSLSSIHPSSSYTCTYTQTRVTCD